MNNTRANLPTRGNSTAGQIIAIHKSCIFLLALSNFIAVSSSHGQNVSDDTQLRRAISALINQYSQARETRDTLLLKSILTSDVDQLVSTGEWRDGINSSVKGMLSSSANSPGTRTLTVERVKSLSPTVAIADCKYEIANPGGNVRRMWSTFIVLSENGKWKISAIRNMLPAGG